MAKTYGNWRVLERLSEGGQAWTSRVRHADGREAVLKLIKNPKRKWRFEREVSALRLLDSPAVPRLLDFGETDGRPWLVTADCGQPLVSVVGGSDLNSRLSWFQDLVLAIRDAHAVGVVHRDIKPTNVVVSDDLKNAYLIDFGICALSDTGPPYTTAEALGNAAFAAPECFLGHLDRPGAACDIYSVGKLLYWLASGGRAIYREQTGDLEGTLPPGLANVHARIISLIRSCVRETSAERPDAPGLLSRTQALYEYAELIVAEERQGAFRLIDNLGNLNEFNAGSSRSVESAEFSASKLHESEKMVGGPRGNVAQAERFENRFDAPRRVKRVTLGMRCLSPEGCVRIPLVGDNDRNPSDHILGEADVYLTHGPAGAHFVECDIIVPPGPFWLVLKASSMPATYASLHIAFDDIAPQRSIFAESYDGGTSWEVKESRRGLGYAIRMETTANVSGN
ncbi:MAG: serine/threonine protein kinase [Acidobacteria bacterium]|nr:serine/threonine protein kinase [Acidobacteriota bacterium]